jgi:hypothetical protein
MNAGVRTPAGRGRPLPLRTKALLLLRIWFWFVVVHVRLRLHPLPEVISRLRARGSRAPLPIAPARLGVVIPAVLTLAGHRPRCLINALIHYRLLTEQGESPEIVIGLPDQAEDHLAHAWVELAGIDVGPPPGRAGHVALARYS